MWVRQERNKNLKFDKMKNSERNFLVIENFILHLTHCSDDERERDFKEKMVFTPEVIYQAARDYIEEDHVDGKNNPEDDMSELDRAERTLKEAGYYVDNLWSVQDVKSKFDCTTEEAQHILNEVFNSDYICAEINNTIQDFGESDGLRKL